MKQAFSFIQVRAYRDSDDDGLLRLAKIGTTAEVHLLNSAVCVFLLADSHLACIQ